MNSQEIYAAVTETYSALSSGTSRSRGIYSKSIARSFGYTEEELDSLPGQANLGLSCGNPLAIASLRKGETIIDLGSGAGFDVFLAARKVGTAGRAIGVDMNKDMLALAEKNKAQSRVDNVEFVHARITSIPLDNEIADAIISNCVINLVPEDEKQLVFNEMFRLLKPGGRVAVSDILAKKALPESLQKSAAAYAGCIAGASLVDQYYTYLNRAGFTDVFIRDSGGDLNVCLDLTPPDDPKQIPTCGKSTTVNTACCSEEEKAAGCYSPGSDKGCCAAPSKTQDHHNPAGLVTEFEGTNLNEFVGSYKIFAVKP